MDLVIEGTASMADLFRRVFHVTPETIQSGEDTLEDNPDTFRFVNQAEFVERTTLIS